MKTMTATLKPASFGSVSTATLRTEDLLSAFLSELEWQVSRNGDYFAQPENHGERDRLAKIIGSAQDCFADDGEGIPEDKESDAEWLVSELQDELQAFAPDYGYFGTHPGDGADFGYWVDVESVKEQVEFVSSRSQDYPDAEFRGEWLHVSDHGNATLYVREDASNADGYADREVWGIA